MDCRFIATWVVVGAVFVTSAVFSVETVHAQTANPTPKASAVPAPEGSGSEGSPAPEPTSTPSRCAEYVDVLSGKKKDDALLNDPNVRAIAAQSVDLVMCLAVARDSDEPCALTPKDAPQHAQECRMTRAVFHELRTNPQGRAFMFPDYKYQACRAEPKVASICDRWRAAARTGDPNQCTGMGEWETECRAELTLDESLCPKTPEPEGCKKAIAAGRAFANGLKSVAQSGSPRDRALAKAALGEQDACAPFAEAAVGNCESPPVPPPADAKTNAAAASPKGPAPRKSPASR